MKVTKDRFEQFKQFLSDSELAQVEIFSESDVKVTGCIGPISIIKVNDLPVTKDYYIYETLYGDGFVVPLSFETFELAESFIDQLGES